MRHPVLATKTSKSDPQNGMELGKGSKVKKNLEFSRFSGWVGLKKSIFQIKKKKNMVSKCIKMPKY